MSGSGCGDGVEFAEKDAAEVEVGDGGLGGVPGLRAELVRWISGARERQGGGSTEAQRPCAAERDAARRARVRWWLRSEMGCRRGRGMPIKDPRGSWGGVPRVDAAAGIAAVMRARTKWSAQ